MSELHDSIARTRELLTTEAERLLNAAAYCGDGLNASYMTRVAVEAERAADTLFDVLNAAHSYLDDPDAGPAMNLSELVKP